MVFVLLAAAMLTAAPAGSEKVFTWQDEKGTTHFTNDPTEVPKRKSKVRETTGEPVSVIKTVLVPGKKDAGSAVQASNEPDERQWRAAFRELNEQIATLEVKLALDRKKVEDPSGLPVTPSYQCWPDPYSPTPGAVNCRYAVNPEFQRTKDRIVENEAAVGRAKERLLELDRSASFAAVPREWRR